MARSPELPVPPKRSEAETSTELAMRRTGMSFQRTRLAADRTLMSVIRTSLSLIGFGFTIYQFFSKLQSEGTVGGAPQASRNFGASLAWLGVGMLVLGIVHHVQFMRGLRHLRESMRSEGLIHGESGFPTSMTLIIALLLLGLGAVAILSMSFHVGPFR